MGEPACEQYVSLMLDIATFLSSNLVACGLKVGDFDKTIIFNSYALEFDPKNVKVSFRRIYSIWVVWMRLLRIFNK